MVAYKAFEKGLVATHGRGRFQFKEGLNITEAAKCASFGFHCAEDPLDMFNYYRNTEDTEYRLVNAGGDIHEDLRDSRIACTELIIGKELSIHEVGMHALCYWQKYPERSRPDYAVSGGFRLIRGKDPHLKGELGELLGFAEGTTDKITKISAFVVDGKRILPGVEYDMDGNKKGDLKCQNR